jgi:phosphotransferase system  glucose/maltose/N-acetylglucosamine-specific IIC component
MFCPSLAADWKLIIDNYNTMNSKLMQIIRLLMMVVAIAGIIFALNYVGSSIGVWFWIGVLGVGFIGLLYTFRLTQRHLQLERRERERKEKEKEKEQKRKSKR